MEERNMVVGMLKSLHKFIVVELIELVDGTVEIHKNNFDSDHYCTTITNNTGTSILVVCRLISRGSRTRLRTIIYNNIVKDEEISFNFNFDDNSVEINYLNVDDGLDEDLVSNDGVLNKFYNNFLKNGVAEEFIRKIR